MAAKPTEASQLGRREESEWHNEPRLIELSLSAARPSACLPVCLPACGFNALAGFNAVLVRVSQ